MLDQSITPKEHNPENKGSQLLRTILNLSTINNHISQYLLSKVVHAILLGSTATLQLQHMIEVFL